MAIARLSGEMGKPFQTRQEKVEDWQLINQTILWQIAGVIRYNISHLSNSVF